MRRLVLFGVDGVVVVASFREGLEARVRVAMLRVLEAVEVALLERAAGGVGRGRLEVRVREEALHRLIDLLVVGQRQAGQLGRDARASRLNKVERRLRRELARGDRRLRLLGGGRAALVERRRLGAALDGGDTGRRRSIGDGRGPRPGT